jgi:hypothetical protein
MKLAHSEQIKTLISLNWELNYQIQWANSTDIKINV